MKILIRGSSIGAGYGVARTYIDIIREIYAAAEVSVINISRFKETSFDAVRSYRDDIAPLTPDVLIVHYGIDDAFNPVYRSEFKENLVHLVRYAREDGIRHIALMTSHPFENINEMKTLEIYYRTVREVALDLQCHYIPVHLFWSGHLYENKLHFNDLLLNDYRFPNEKGHELYAVILNNYLTSLRDGYYERDN